jgi:hypothetical protein
MKYIVFIILFFYLISSNAQDQKAYLSLSPQFSHYIPVENNNYSQNEDVTYNISPGIELLYNYPLGQNSKLATGLSYTYASLISNANGADKFIFGEISLPFIFTLTEKNNRLSVETGIYAGK